MRPDHSNSVTLAAVEEPDYPAAVRRLTAANRKLHADLRGAKDAHAQEIRWLRAQLAEGLTPELLVLRQELRYWRQRARVAEGRVAAMKRSGSAA